MYGKVPAEKTITGNPLVWWVEQQERNKAAPVPKHPINNARVKKGLKVEKGWPRHNPGPQVCNGECIIHP